MDTFSIPCVENNAISAFDCFESTKAIKKKNSSSVIILTQGCTNINIIANVFFCTSPCAGCLKEEIIPFVCLFFSKR